jgi:hypothetical protein
MRVSEPSNQMETTIAPQIMRVGYDNESDKVLKRPKAPYNMGISVAINIYNFILYNNTTHYKLL